ncbi:DUF1360 domain-containing protein [Streptomyces sp. A73]|uniref:DUF1360 domain-containing protein n=1 Tax=Streptomyces TaxID=1883 RepID=UPI00161C7C0C|nr:MULTISPECIES: DUF1360 domain-containing protein [unclassified Streptomyces]MBQ0865231.1 DUF1360 domain-containing protein [Streptomyces sp. RK75]MBQ1121050.1 DUF1360 domain-containing protein [Streptomyces sp. B15]MBQ1159234.1 DUF1360 domain-containing protein [Streptomyces sp. A73]
MPSMQRTAREAVREHEHEYAPDAERPLGGYLAVLSSFGTGVVGAALAARWAGRRAPKRLSTRELVLLTLATHKLARMVAKDAVASPLRAPFARYQGTGAPAEVAEEPRGKGLRHAVGELVTCPFCLAPWAASALLILHAAAPATARTCTTGLTAVAGSDFLQYAYAAAQERHSPHD